MEGQEDAVSESAKRGKAIFIDKANCFECHFGPDFTQDEMLNIGIYDGKKYSDRVYFRHDWLENLMKEKLRKGGISPISEETIKSVQLEKWEFEYYPYADNFYFLDRTNGTLVSIQTDGVIQDYRRFSQLRNTNGRIG